MNKVVVLQIKCPLVWESLSSGVEGLDNFCFSAL